MRFLVAQMVKKPNKASLEDCGDYCVQIDGTVIMRCPVDGTLASLPPRCGIKSTNPLCVEFPFQFPCETFHAFRCWDNKLQSSSYRGPDVFHGPIHREPILGFDVPEGNHSNGGAS